MIKLLKCICIKKYYLKKSSNILLLYDRTLLWLTLCLICIGFVMVTSASMPIGTRLFNDKFYFSKRCAFYLFIIFIISMCTLHMPMMILQHYSLIILLITILMLVIVLVFGSSINGASRWITIGILRIQPAELSKLAFYCYLCSYLVRNIKVVRTNLLELCKPIVIMVLIAFILLAQPDMGTVIVIFVTTLAIIFLAGAKILHLLFIICLGIVAVWLLIISEPYRMQRVIYFLNPWENTFESGYQITQSLIALGRGKFFGQGLGNSIQKLEYLPEAHTDFIFSILGEELGYLGVVLALFIIFFVSFRAMYIGRKALEIDNIFSGFLACSIGIWFSFQSIVNIGSTVGILPTEGITLPLISYGGSSFFIIYTAIVLLLRIDFETRLAHEQAFIMRK